MDYSNNPNNIRLKKIIKYLGLTKPGAKIAAITGQHKSNISSFMNDRKPTPDIVITKLYDNYDITEEVVQSVVLDSVEVKKEVIPINSDKITKSNSSRGFYKNQDFLVPFYDIDFSAGADIYTLDNNQVQPDYYMDVPEFSGCTAFRAYSDSMEKLIKSGSILFGTKVEQWNLHLEYGQIYGIICTDGRRYLKYIRRHHENNKELFLLKSENEMYDDFDIPKSAIRSVWLIHGWLNKRT